MKKEDKCLIINDLIKSSFSISEIQTQLEFSLMRTICKGDAQYINENYRIIFEFLLANDFIKESNVGVKFVFTKEWEELREVGSLEQYFLNLKINENYENSLKERSKEIAEESLQLSKVANNISSESLTESKNANKISSQSKWISTVAVAVSIIAIIISFKNNDSKDVESLNKKINSVEADIRINNERYLKHIDSLNDKIDKLKSKK